MKIIAEIGSNWQSLNDCLRSIEKAKECGADIVKFQMFTKKELHGPMIPTIGDDRIRRWIPTLKAAADAVGIEFMCTGFSAEGYKYLDPYVLRHKVASSECTHPQILDYLNTTGKEVLLSVAGAEIDAEIKPALDRILDVSVCLMHCVADYPAKSNAIYQYRKLKELAAKRNLNLGYSDHTVKIWIQMAPVSYYEKHVTFINAQTPDSPHSLNEAEFKFFCKSNLFEEQEDHLLNQDMIKLHRRRLIALRTIEPGEKLELDVNVGIYRACITRTENHIKPLDKWQGLEVKKQVAKGYAVTWSDI